MEKIEFTASFQVGEKDVTSIEVKPLTFLGLGKLWERMPAGAKPETYLNRARLVEQAVFKNGSEELTPSPQDVTKLPAAVAKAIITKLDVGAGPRGKVINKGDGTSSPILYKLGTPIKMKGGDGKELVIEELEFQASTYGELEDVLAAENEVQKAIELITRIAVPVGIDSLTRLPGWAIDRFTLADGIGIMKEVNPAF
jgi:hypothetical protein